MRSNLKEFERPTKIERHHLGEKEYQVEIEFESGRLAYYSMSHKHKKSIDHNEFYRTPHFSRQLIFIDAECQYLVPEVLKRVDSINLHIDGFIDEADRGDGFSIDLDNRCHLMADGKSQVTLQQLCWHRYDPPEGRALIGSREGKYFPENLYRYTWEIDVSISEYGELMSFDIGDIGDGSVVSLADPIVSDKDLARLWQFSGFGFEGEDEEIDAAIARFKKSRRLSDQHRAIRERIRKFF